MNKRGNCKKRFDVDEPIGQKPKQRFSFSGNIRLLCFAAILASMSLILGKFLQIPNPFQDFIRISFENIPIILSGLTMGPFAGALVGAVADVLGCLLYGYAINPVITLGAVSIGLISGLSARFIPPRLVAVRVILAEIISHAVGSVFIKSFGLASWYAANYSLSFWAFVGWRALTYLFIAAAESVILILFLRNRAVSSQIERMCKRR